MNNQMVTKSKLGVILVIDDEPADNYLTRYLLEKNLTNRVVALEIVRQAIDFLQKNHQQGLSDEEEPVMVFLDVVMPGKSGAEFVQWCKSAPSKAMREVPIVVVTQYPEHIQVKKALDNGAERMFQKPFNFSELNTWLTQDTAIVKIQETENGRFVTRN